MGKNLKFDRLAVLRAEVTGVDLAAELTDEFIAEIDQGLLEHRVLFFRDQDLSGDGLVALSRRFGKSFVQPAHYPHKAPRPELLNFRFFFGWAPQLRAPP